MGGLYIYSPYNRGGAGGSGAGGGGVAGNPTAPVLPPLPQLPEDVTSPAPAPVKVNLHAAPDPTSLWATSQMQQRYSGDMGAGRAIDLAGGKIREAGEGAQRELDASLARRGISGTGAEGLLRGKVEAQTQRGIASAAGDIASQAEGRRDALLTGVVGAAGQMSAAQRAQEELQLQAAQIDAQNQRAAEAAADARRTAILGMLSGLA